MALVFVAVAASSLCWVFFFNLAPILVWQDSAEILNIAAHGFPGFFRTVFYGFFVRATGLGITSIPAVFAQSILLTICFFRLHAHLFPSASNVVRCLCVVVLSLSTSAPFFMSAIKEDAFTPILLLAYACAVLARDVREVLFYSALFAFSSVAHQANLATALAIAAVGLLRRIPGAWTMTAVVAGSFAIVPVSQALSGGSYAYPEGNWVNFLGRLHIAKMVNPFLERHCNDATWALCAQREAVQKASRTELMWRIIVRRPELRAQTKQLSLAIVRESPMQFLSSAIASTPLAWTARGQEWHITGQYPLSAIRTTLPADVSMYAKALQLESRNTLRSAYFASEMRQRTLSILGAIIAVVTALLGFSRLLPAAHGLFAQVTVVGILANAFVCVGLVSAESRFHLRLEWVLCWYAIVCVAAAASWLAAKARFRFFSETDTVRRPVGA